MKSLLIISILLCVYPCNGQERATLKKLKEQRQKEKEYAENAIHDLRNGVLLVRLDFKQKKVAYYEKYNNQKEADKIREKQRRINTAIMQSFDTNFTFCKVYYFALSDSRTLLENGPDSVIFYSSEATPDSTIKLSDSLYFIAEFGKIAQDTTAYISGSITETEAKNRQRTTYYGGTKNTRSALVIMNKEFIQLRDPFPYYEKYIPTGAISRRYQSPVLKLNKKLYDYLGEKE